MSIERLSNWEIKIATACPELAAVHCFISVGSTMDNARELFSISKGKFGLVMAEQQQQGRGRLGRPWASGQSGFYGTYYLQSDISSAALVGFSLVLGCIVRRACQVFGAETKLKWPNDVYSVRGEKLAGILIELSTQGAITQLCAGVGLNLSGAPKLEQASTDLQKLVNQKIEASQFAIVLSQQLLAAWPIYLQHGLMAFYEEWLGSAYALGSQIRVVSGDTEVEGVFDGINEQGHLLVSSGREQFLFAAGQVRYV
jgi:BirA family biotin operon repressor/biotin-[acetyl-CoA-carboxylase] ligase